MLSIAQASELVGVTPNTLRVWEKAGKIKSYRTTGGHRRYKEDELLSIAKPMPDDKRYVVAYCRVSSNGQKNDLQTQVSNVSAYCIAKGYSFQVISDIGSGLNYNKAGLKELISLILAKRISRIVVNYKDRLIRYGFEMLEQICTANDVSIEIINLSEDKTYEQELVEDVLSIITVFSARLYGSRSHKSAEVVKQSKALLTKSTD